jgi:hypothetical protein
MTTDKSRETEEVCAPIDREVGAEPGKKGGIVAALLRSPLVGADLDLIRPRIDCRKIEL